MIRPAFVFDQNRCTGCHACRLACTIENELPLSESWRQVVTFNPNREPDLPLFHLSIACNHCAQAACMTACPAAAYSRDRATGAVLIDGARCIGCRYCTWACPYDAPRFASAQGVVTKCTFCNERVREGRQPACAAYCPTGALEVRDVAEPELTLRAVGLPDGSRLLPALQVIPWAGRRALRSSGDDRRSPPADAGASKITLRSEWALAVFTLAAAVLVGLFAAHVVAGTALRPMPFLGIALPAMALSASHLGRKTRAWRAILGIGTSWLSREVVAFTAFVAMGLATLIWADAPSPLGFTALAVGVLGLFAVDRVYDVAEFRAWARPHSAGAFLTGLFLGGVMAGSGPVAASVGALKTVLYLRRKLGAGAPWTGSRRLVSALRLGLGMVLPATLWTAQSELWGVLLASVVAGELIDRCEFYDELDVPSPARCMEIDLATQTGAGTTRMRPAA